MNIRKLFVLGCLLCLSFSLALAQGTTSRISGVATDPSGAGVANATITVTNDDTGVSYVIKTSASGTYAFDSLQIGRYTLRAEAPGFKQFISKGNVLAIGVPTSINPKLQVGATTETVQVQGGYDLIETESSGNFGAVIDNVSLVQLPVVGTRGRNVLSFTQFVPGVVQNGGNAPGGDIVVNGSRDRAWNYVLDGIDDNESSSGGSGTSPSHQNPDMLSEFRVITSNFTAEYGRNTGGQVVMVTKSGTNKFHGNLFEFYQSPFLRADSAAAKAATPPLPPTQFVQNIPGGSVGGPIWKDKAFFFYNLELLHALTGTVVTRYVYTPLAKQGKFRYVTSGQNLAYGATDANHDPSSVDASGNVASGVAYNTYDMVANDPFGVGLDPTVKAYLALAPAPNTYVVGDGLNIAGYTFTGPSTDKQVDQTYKIDYVFNEKNALFGRWSSGHQNTYADVVNGGLQAFPGDPALVNTFRQPRNLAINYRFSPTTNTTNELVAGFNRFGYAFVNPAYSQAISTPYNFNTIDGYTITSPTSSYISNNRYLTTLQAVDNFTWVKGPHIFKAGVNLRIGREIDHRGSIGSLNAIPQVTFDTTDDPLDYTHYNVPTTQINTTYDQPDLASATNDLLGRIGSIAAGYVSNATLTAFKPADSINIMDTRWPEYDFYVQDTWHVLSNFVIDVGVRDDARMAPRFKGFPGLVPNQDLRKGNPLTTTLQFVPGRYMKDRWDNFGPSVGFSYDPFKNGKTSIRGNFRIAFDRINSFSFSSSVFQGMPGLTYQITNSTSGQDNFTTDTQGTRAANWSAPVPLKTPAQLTTPPTYSTNAITVSDPDMQTPTSTQWGLSIQHQLMRNTGLTLSYVGNHGTHLYGGYDSNQVDYTSNGFLAAFQAAQAGQDTSLMTQIVSGDTRYLAGEGGVQFLNNNGYTTYLTHNNVAGLANVFANRLQHPTTANPYGVPLVVSSGLSPTFFKPYQAYLGGLDVLQTHDYSNYNGLQVQAEHRFSQGFSITANYTYSKTLDIRSFDPTFTLVATGSSQSAAGTPFDYNHPHLNYAASDLDSAQVVSGYYVIDLPFGRDKKFGAHMNRIVDEVIGGWRIAGDGYWQTGRPITLYSGYNTFSGSVQTPVNCLGCNAHMGKIQQYSGQTWFLSTAQKAMFSVPAAGQFSNTGRNWFRQESVWNTDATLSKSFITYHEQYLQIRVEAQNLMNNVTYDTFGSQSMQSSVFMRLNEATDGVLNNSPRRMQLSAKYVF